MEERCRWCKAADAERRPLCECVICGELVCPSCRAGTGDLSDGYTCLSACAGKYWARVRRRSTTRSFSKTERAVLALAKSMLWLSVGLATFYLFLMMLAALY